MSRIEPRETRSDAPPATVADGRRTRPGALRPILLLAFATTVLKLTILLFPSTDVSPGWVYRDELHRGNIASEILRGPILPIQDYHHTESSGGAVVVGALGAPLYATFGLLLDDPPRYRIVVLRLVPILFSVLAVVALFALLDAIAGRRVAWIGGLLLALAPPGYSLNSIVAWGGHAESNLLVLTFLWLLLAPRSRPGGDSARHFVAGLVGGFATYFLYTSAIVVALGAAFRLFADRRWVLRRTFAAFAVGAAVGILPWITYNMSHDFGGLSIYGSTIGERFGVPDALARATALVGRVIPSSLFFKGFPVVDRAAVEWSVYLVLAASFAYALWGARGAVKRNALDPILVCLAYPFVFALAWTLIDVGQMGHWADSAVAGAAHQGRYCVLLLPFLIAGTAAGLGQLSHLGPWALLASRAATVFVCAAGLVGTLAVCDFSNFGGHNGLPGNSTAELARFFAWRYSTDVGRLDEIVTSLEEKRGHRVREAVLFVMSERLRKQIAGAADTPAGRAEAERLLTALEFLHSRVEDLYKPYFDLQYSNESREFSFRERARFWKTRRERADPDDESDP